MSSNVSRILFAGVFMCLFLFNTALSQPKDWDEVSREELEMKVYLADSSAAAVVLFDKADVSFNNNLEYVMERHIRIKIFSEEGYKWATTQITYNEELDQDISKIRGHTFTLNEKGKAKKHKLDKNSIFKEEVAGNFKRIKFTLPGLEPGAVIEYRYRMHIGSPHLLPDWEFQKSIPVAWSEYNVKIPDWFFYNKMLVGSNQLHISESEPFHERLVFTLKERSGFYQLKTSYHNLSLEVDGFNNRWVMKDLPAVKKLPYMTSVDDYKSKLWMQLTEIRIPGQVQKHFLKSWNDVAEELRRFDSFGGQLRSRSEYQSVIKKLTVGLSDPAEKMQAVYQYVVESMVWDGTYTIFARKDIDDVFKAKKGTGSELNLLLVQLLREAGLEANPVLLSTREHGKIVEYFAIANQFNHVIACVQIAGETYLLDAVSDDSSVHILPLQDLNGNGLMVANEEESWVELRSRVPTKSKVIFNARITRAGDVNGDLFVSSWGYDASKDASELAGKGKEKFIDAVFNRHFKQGAIDSFEVKSENMNKGELDYNLHLNKADLSESQQSGDRWYFNPMLFLREKENPFPQPERKIPVDFPHLFEKEYIANFVVPEGYSIEEIPGPKMISTPDGAAQLKRLTQVTQNRITILSKLSINKKTFQPEEYQALREFYSHAVNLHNEQIVLKSEMASSGSQE